MMAVMMAAVVITLTLTTPNSDLIIFNSPLALRQEEMAQKRSTVYPVLHLPVRLPIMPPFTRLLRRQMIPTMKVFVAAMKKVRRANNIIIIMTYQQHYSNHQLMVVVRM